MAGRIGPWETLASSYPRQIWLERAALRALIEMLAIAPQERLLDVGTGPAVLLAELARSPSPPVRACGIDSSPEMLARAPVLPDAWSLGVGDAASLPFEDNSFDVVTASYLLHVLDAGDRRRVLGETRRVLRPGGRLGTITVAPPRGRMASLLSAPIRRAAHRSGGALAGLRPLDPAPELIEAGLGELARRHSFRGYPSLCLVAA